ncbi:hypothetical protein AALP_AA1G206000 [Arabis alpina]|uniref:Uncharacterized protein n=1 Tax=Arabis alpina TaxID=50452 RepID=A0A087HPH6_ARAAL|nr:hypothetical protein AALP_AA1G206000 [Arabis alpina]
MHLMVLNIVWEIYLHEKINCEAYDLIDNFGFCCSLNFDLVSASDDKKTGTSESPLLGDENDE